MQFVGRFKELEPAYDCAPLLASLLGQISTECAEQVAQYLKRGIPAFDVMEAVVDPIDGVTVIPGGSSLLTDGEWVWRHDLAYFVQKYRIGLPTEFVAHVVASVGGGNTSAVDIRGRIDEVLRVAGWRD